MRPWETTVLEAVGRMIEFWGFKRNHGRIWSLLFLVDGNRSTPRPVRILASGEEGVRVPDSLAGATVAVAKPDILLRLLTGYPFVATPRER